MKDKDLVEKVDTLELKTMHLLEAMNKMTKLHKYHISKLEYLHNYCEDLLKMLSDIDLGLSSLRKNEQN